MLILMLIYILNGLCGFLYHQHFCANVLVVFVFVSLTFVLPPLSIYVCLALKIVVSLYFVGKVQVVAKSSSMSITCVLHATAMACTV